jgi:hypothetical protein
MFGCALIVRSSGVDDEKAIEGCGSGSRGTHGRRDRRVFWMSREAKPIRTIRSQTRGQVAPGSQAARQRARGTHPLELKNIIISSTIVDMNAIFGIMALALETGLLAGWVSSRVV